MSKSVGWLISLVVAIIAIIVAFFLGGWQLAGLMFIFAVVGSALKLLQQLILGNRY